MYRPIFLIIVCVFVCSCSVEESLQEVSRKDTASRAAQSVAGELIDEPGVYKSPTGDRYLEIVGIGADKFKWASFEIGYEETISGTHPFDAEVDWFMCWDEENRLWLFIEDSEIRGGENQTRSISCLFWGGTPSSDWGWSGGGKINKGEFDIPEAFWERLPEDIKAPVQPEMSVS